ncbi:hypothetical protein KR018_011124, partial [Drosophila ironensis]
TMLYFIYGVLQTISTTVYTVLSTVCRIQRKSIDIIAIVTQPSQPERDPDPPEVVTNFMMDSSLFVAGVACHPLMVVPMLYCLYTAIRNYWFQRVKIPQTPPRIEASPEEGQIRPGMPRTPRFRFRNMGNLSTRSEPTDN